MMKKSQLYYASFSLLLATTLTACQESRNTRFAREAREYTERNCPKRMDQFTILDSLVFNAETASMTYYYTVEDDDELREKLLSIKDEYSKTLISRIRNSIELKNVKEAGMNLTYSYRSASTDKTFLEFTFTKEDYR